MNPITYKSDSNVYGMREPYNAYHESIFVQNLL